MKKIIFIAFAAVSLMSSCVSAEKVQIINVKDVQANDMSKIELTLTVHNGNAHKITLKEAKFDVSIDGKVLAQVKAMDKIVIPRRQTSDVAIPLRINIIDLMGIIAVSQDSEKINEAIVSGDVIIKSSIFRKKHKFKDLRLKDVTDAIESKIEK